MENGIGALVLVVVVMSIFANQQGKDIQSLDVLPEVTEYREKETAKKRTTVPAAKQPKVVISVTTDSAKLFREVGSIYVVPAGLLYGVCKKESDCLASGYSANWPLAKDLLDGECAEHYPRAWCLEKWKALKLVCGQQRKDGTTVCDPYTVRTSYAYAMGPTQSLPTTILHQMRSDAQLDCDGDGAVDPHSLADALCLTASHLRRKYERRTTATGNGNDAWIWAANAYFGSQESGYYAGRMVTKETKHGTKQVRAKGVGEHWSAWCAAQKCGTERAMMAAK